MDMKRNYRKELDGVLEKIVQSGTVPSLLLHACCAPCSSSVLEYLSRYFRITVLYYNPNIYPQAEYARRAEELRRFVSVRTDGGVFSRGVFPAGHSEVSVAYAEGDYKPDQFYEAVKGLENEPEGGKRCSVCYRLRLEKAAAYAAERGFDFFTTTLSVSPYKDAQRLNETGEYLAGVYGVPYLVSDFKKKNGFKRSLELSAQYGLYRQEYCGCVYSMRGK